MLQQQTPGGTTVVKMHFDEREAVELLFYR
jgi:hypothetical protein